MKLGWAIRQESVGQRGSESDGNLIVVRATNVAPLYVKGAFWVWIYGSQELIYGDD